LTLLEYDEEYKLIVVVADGEVTGSGNELSTPDILKKICVMDESEPAAYISLAPGQKRYNRARVHGGYYEKNGKRSKILVISKCGNPFETSKKGKRGKRDSQVITMSFFSKLIYGDRMCDLDLEIYRKIQHLMPQKCYLPTLIIFNIEL